METKTIAFALMLLSMPLLAATGQSPADFQKAANFEVNLPGAPFGVDVSGDKQWIFVSLSGGGPGGNPSIAVLHTKDGHLEVAQTIPMQSSPAGIVLTHDGSMLIAAADDAVVFFDTKRLETGGSDAAFQWISDGPNASSVYVNVTADDKTLFVSDEGNQTITVIDLEKIRSTGRDSDANLKRFNSGGGAQDAIIGRIPVGLGPIALTISKDQRWLFTTSEVAPPDWKWPDVMNPEGAGPEAAKVPEGAVIVIDIAKARTNPSESVIARVPAGGSPVRLAISPDDSRLFVTARNSNAVLVFDTAKLIKDPGHATPEKAPVGASPVPIAVVMDGKLALAGNSNRFSPDAGKRSTVSVLDVSRIGTERDPMLGQITCGAFPREFHLSADGKTLFLTNFISRTLEVIDVGRLTAPGVSGLILSPAVKSVATISGTNADVVLKPAAGANPHRALIMALNQAKQIFMACESYAGDNNDVFPDKISELVPEYLSADQCKDPLTANEDFILLGGHDSDSPPKPVVMSAGKTSYGKHIVVDTKGKVDER
jgi:DNA-binding beta-propeller fold protein YncE